MLGWNFVSIYMVYMTTIYSYLFGEINLIGWNFHQHCVLWGVIPTYPELHTLRIRYTRTLDGHLCMNNWPKLILHHRHSNVVNLLPRPFSNRVNNADRENRQKLAHSSHPLNTSLNNFTLMSLRIFMTG